MSGGGAQRAGMAPSLRLPLTGCLLAVAANAAEIDPAVAYDFARFGARHAHYLPESGEPVLNRGFQNWNYLVLNMAVWREGGEPVAEF